MIQSDETSSSRRARRDTIWSASESQARTATYMASSVYSTRKSVGCVPGSPSFGSSCQKPFETGASLHTASSIRPSTRGACVARTAIAVRMAVGSMALSSVVLLRLAFCARVAEPGIAKRPAVRAVRTAMCHDSLLRGANGLGLYCVDSFVVPPGCRGHCALRGAKLISFGQLRAWGRNEEMPDSLRSATIALRGAPVATVHPGQRSVPLPGSYVYRIVGC